MGFYIQYRNTLCRSLKINVSPASPFQHILAALNAIRYNGVALTTEQINYAVLELLNNSLRAHRSRGIKEPITLRFTMKPNGLHVSIKDRGGGFDPSTLPYDLTEDPERIDVHHPAFEAYRQHHNYARFGLGIYLAKKTFPRFTLSFIDHRGELREEHGEEIVGTVIELSTASRDGGDARSPVGGSTALEQGDMYAS
jgi:anti-sigma regulatory factor (Ser/Thr protein kinase)